MVQRSSLIAAVSLLVLTSGPIAGQTVGDATGAAAQIGQGRDTFRQYCASCHGLDGKGNGPAASALKSRPTDLTTLAKRKGSFQVAAVDAAIRGIAGAQLTEHEPLPAHGSYAMPVWGPYFSAVASNETEAGQRVTDLVKFIESIQAR